MERHACARRWCGMRGCVGGLAASQRRAQVVRQGSADVSGGSECAPPQAPTGIRLSLSA